MSISLIGLSKQQLKEKLPVSDVQANMRANQIWQWLYGRGAKNFTQMKNLGKPLQETLAKNFTLARPEIANHEISKDGTNKWLLRFGDGNESVEAECVFIPEAGRGTLCLSSQVGCTLNCPFCHTGTQKLVRNLTAGEILQQIMVAKDYLQDFNNEHRKITNIVMMGMGEPLYNFEEVKKALLIVCDGSGLAFSKRRVTLSTSGIVPFIERTGREIGCGLAISLHATNDKLRDILVPINKKYPLQELLQACKNYPTMSNARRITFEYVMLKGVNDSLGAAKELVKLLKGISAKINLIPFNPWPNSPYECSHWSDIEKFADYINKKGYASPIRTPRGRDISAACGQLKSKSKRLPIKQRRALQHE